MKGVFKLSKTTALDDELLRNKYLTFMLGEEAYGIEISFVTEIIELQKISHIPESPDYLKGIINLRGKIIPVMDMRLRLRMDSSVYTSKSCIIVIHVKDQTVGLIVDCVNEVESISNNVIEPLPTFNTEYQNRFIKEIGKSGEQVRLILDCESILCQLPSDMIIDKCQII